MYHFSGSSSKKTFFFCFFYFLDVLDANKLLAVYLYPVWHCLQHAVSRCVSKCQMKRTLMCNCFVFFHKTFTWYTKKMYAATFPVHIKFRIKRKAVPSCLLPRPPRLSSLPPQLRTLIRWVCSIKQRDSFSCQKLSNLSGRLAEVFFPDRQRGRQHTVWNMVHSCRGSSWWANSHLAPSNNCVSAWSDVLTHWGNLPEHLCASCY